jgi:hypothetical protein
MLFNLHFMRLPCLSNGIFAFSIGFLLLTSDFSYAISSNSRWLSVPVYIIQARSEDDRGISQVKKILSV